MIEVRTRYRFALSRADRNRLRRGDLARLPKRWIPKYNCYMGSLPWEDPREIACQEGLY